MELMIAGAVVMTVLMLGDAMALAAGSPALHRVGLRAARWEFTTPTGTADLDTQHLVGDGRTGFRCFDDGSVGLWWNPTKAGGALVAAWCSPRLRVVGANLVSALVTRTGGTTCVELRFRVTLPLLGAWVLALMAMPFTVGLPRWASLVGVAIGAGVAWAAATSFREVEERALALASSR